MAILTKEVMMKEEKEVRTLSVCAKCSDCFSGALVNEAGQVIHRYDGYVPSNLGIGGGDYVEFNIDLYTGKILNWNPVHEIKIAEDE